MRRSAGITAALLAAVVIFGLANAPQLRAQSQETNSASAISFEVASIKLDQSESGHRSISFTPGRFSTLGTSAKFLIEYAYSLESDAQLSGGPSWINSDKYEIEAKVDDTLADKLEKLPIQERRDQVKSMVRSLLADRFELQVSHATKQLPVYALVVLKSGPKLNAAAPSSSKDSGNISSSVHGTVGELVATDASIRSFLGTLARQPELAGRTVVDETGLQGGFDFKLHWTREDLEPEVNEKADHNVGIANTPSAAASGPSLFTALQEQLGLKLESRKGPVDVIVIEHIEKPSEN